MMRRPTTVAAALLALGVASSAVPRRALAQQGATTTTGSVSQPERARLLAQAQRARERGEHAQALFYAEQAARLRATSSVQRFVAEEQVELGRHLEARESAVECVRLAEAEPPSENHAVVLDGCRHLVGEIERRLGRVELRVPAVVPAGLSVTVAERRVPFESLSAPVWVLPGSITVLATAPRVRAFAAVVDVTAGGSAAVSLVLTPEGEASASTEPRAVPTGSGSQSAPAGSSAPPGATPTSTQPSAQVNAPIHESDSRARPQGATGVTMSPVPAPGRSPVGLIIAGGGVLLAGAGAIGFGLNERTYQELREHCAGMNPCDNDRARMLAFAVRRGDIATNVLFFTGLAVAGAGLVVWLVSSPPRERASSPSRASATVFVDPASGSLGVAGVF